MKEFFRKIEVYMDNLKIKKKFYLLYILCVLVPLIVTDSVVFSVVMRAEKETQEHNMANISNSVVYSLSSIGTNVSEIGKSIYTNRYINEFLTKQYEDSLEYVVSYQDFFKGTLFESGIGMENVELTMYADNDTLVNGGKINQISAIRDTEYYQQLLESGQNKQMYFIYDESHVTAVQSQRRMLFLQKLDFYSNPDIEKVLLIEFDYGTMIRTLEHMNLGSDVYICQGDRIVLSNGDYGSVGKEFHILEDKQKVGYVQTMNMNGMELDVYVMEGEQVLWGEIIKNLPLILLLILVNAVLPLLLVVCLNHSFIKRISELSDVFRSVDSEHLIPIRNVRGKDEIGSLMRNYNRMVVRSNELIQTVYKNKIIEQEMLVERQNAELLALHSQINPHFLFNALESIRMHSVLKKELETADMVEKLAVMQRQYVEWGNDHVEIQKEMEFVKAYLGLQKYRFGDRLNYSLEIEKECHEKKLPKLTIVTFVENACVHGIESKITPGWIFVRIFQEKEELCIEIEDTGIGMEVEEMQNLKERMQSASIEMLKEKGRVGIINACLRLKMVTENQVRFELDGEEGVGTMVSIRIPLKFV